MTVKDLINHLLDFNMNAELDIIVHNIPYAFTIVWGGSEGVTKQGTDEVSFYVDALCDNEKEIP